jgi:spermidine/putrescine transport system permease protein
VSPGLATISIAHVVLILPVAYVPIRARLQGLDPALFEAASDLYASPSLTFRRITLPLIGPGIAAGALLAFIGSFSDVVVSYFVSGPRSTTLPVYALSMVRVGVTPLINAVSTLLLIAPTAILIIAHFFNRSQEKRMEALA